MLEQYCELRRRGFGQQAIQTKASWPRHYPSLLLEEAQRRDMPGAQGSQAQAVTEWLLAMFDAGTEHRVIQRMSAFTGLQTNKQLKAALDAASGPAPTDIIIRNLDGTPARVSWLDTNGNLMHRPFDGAFPADYPAAARRSGNVQKSCTGYWATQTIPPVIVPTPCCPWQRPACTRSTTTPERRVHAELDRAGLDEDAKRTFILKLHPHPSVGQLLVQRCGMSSKWLTGNKARSLSRLMRHHEFSPAFTRNVVEHLGNNPDTYYIIGADYRIAEPSRRGKGPVHTSVAGSRVQRRHHRERLVDVGSPARRTPPAETKQQGRMA